MLKFHKKRHHQAGKPGPGGLKVNCCTAIFVAHPDWQEGPGGASTLPRRWITGVRARAGRGGQR